MLILLIGAAVLTLATLLVVALVGVGMRLAGRRPRRFWRRVWLVHGALAIVHLFATLPIALGFLGTRSVQTRGDEAKYGGPRIDAAGQWLVQTRETLAAERRKETAVDPEIARAAADRAVYFTASDGVRLRGFLVPPRSSSSDASPRFVAVLAHGLFRGAAELEPAGSMLRELGGEVLLLEWRNHGGSGRSRPTYGKDESLDVKAAVAFLRARPEAQQKPLVLFGVSLGTAAIALAAPEIPDVAALILDAPIDDLRATADRLLGASMLGPHAGLKFPKLFRAIMLWSAETLGGVDLDAVRPRDVLARLAPTLPIFMIGAGHDERVPPESVRAWFDALPTRADLKTLWIVDEAEHGRVWFADAKGYQERLARFMEKVAPAR